MQNGIQTNVHNTSFSMLLRFSLEDPTRESIKIRKIQCWLLYRLKLNDDCVRLSHEHDISDVLINGTVYSTRKNLQLDKQYLIILFIQKSVDRMSHGNK